MSAFVIQLVVAAAALAGVVVSVIALVHTRRKDDIEIKVEERVSQFDELERMNNVLRLGLQDAQGQTERLRDDLAIARAEIAEAQAQMLKVNRALDVALANVTLLDDFIEAHVPPEVPRPPLRRMTR